MEFVIILLIVLVIVGGLLIAGSRNKQAQIADLRGPVEQSKAQIVDGIGYLDNYIDVLPKNNADSDQVRAHRQAAAYKLDQADKILARPTDQLALGRAQSLLDQAGADIDNARRYLDRATGGTGQTTPLGSNTAVQPIPFPMNQQQVNQVPAAQRGVSFFSSQPAPISALVPVQLNVDGQMRTVMATPQEAESIQRGAVPQVRSFNVGGQQVPWYAYQQYDPYQDYYTYQNNGWRGVAGGAIAGFLGAEVLGSLLQPRYGYGYMSPYGFGPGFDSWGGWGDMGYGGMGYGQGYDQGFMSGEQQARMDDPGAYGGYDSNYGAGGAGFMGGGGSGYDQSDYGSGGASFMGGDRS